LTFLPQIALLFFFLSLLEDSGYMARAAFIMDRLLKRFGLRERRSSPCSWASAAQWPAIMGARTMENEKDRRLTIMLIPFMSCSAKLPVYGLISAAFFGKYTRASPFRPLCPRHGHGDTVRNTVQAHLFKGETAAFVLELPPYRMPSLGNTLQHVWEKIRGFIVRAGTVILL
jgi:ferrous iron transport protein B